MIEALEPRRLLSDEMRIDAGSSANYIDSSGHLWQTDTDYRSGEVKTWAFAPKGTSDPGLLVTRREGASFRYVVPVDDGEYTVTLLEAEPFFKQAGQRIFDVYAQNQRVISGWDLFASAGYAVATQKSFTVDVQNGSLELQFVGDKDEAIVGAIDIVPAAAIPPLPQAPDRAGASWNSTGNIIVNWDDESGGEDSFRIDRSTDGGKYYTISSGTESYSSVYVDKQVTPGHLYSYRVRAINLSGASLAVTANVSTNKPGGPTPFSGKPVSVPAEIQCENFDNGGNGISYYDSDLTDDGSTAGAPWDGSYRATPVDLQPVWSVPGDYETCYASAGEWTDYTISIPTSQTYHIQTRFGEPGTGATIHYELDGKRVTPEIHLTDTGDWDVYATVTASTSLLPAGVHVLKMVLDTGSPQAGYVGNFDWFKLQAINGNTTTTAKVATSLGPTATATSDLFSTSAVTDDRLDGIL